jgi:hypothetical protein
VFREGETRARARPRPRARKLQPRNRYFLANHTRPIRNQSTSTSNENDLESGREMTTLVSQNVADNFYQETIQAPKSPFDLSLRPPLFSEFLGQVRVKERLELMVAAAKQRGDVL